MSFSLLSLLFPPKCPVCRDKREEDRVLCTKCLSEYQKDKYRPCRRCGKRSCRCTCRPTVSTPDALQYLSVFHYDERSPGGRLILKLKDRQDKRIASFLARDMAKSLENGCILRSDALVTYVPRDPKTVLEKGTDQAKALAAALADHCTLKLVGCLERSGGGKMQKTLSAKERFENAKALYELSADCPDLKGRQVILVDDVLTGGATLSVCASLLKRGGASSVICLSAGRR